MREKGWVWGDEVEVVRWYGGIIHEKIALHVHVFAN